MNTREPKLYRLKYAATLLLAAAVMSPVMDTTGVVEYPSVPESSLENISSEITPDGKNIYRLTDLSYQRRGAPMSADITLSFNTPASRLWKDDTGNYRIASASYTFVRGSGSMGGGCALFYKQQHGVKIRSTRNLWLGSCEDLGSFTIEFRFKPSSLRNRAMIFSRTGYTSGKKTGIEIYLNNGRVVADVRGVFRKSNGRSIDVTLHRGQQLRSGKWYRFCLSYNRTSGRIAKYINGMEEESLFVTEKGEPFIGAYSPAFTYRNSSGKNVCDHPVTEIGRNYPGLIDEFRITHRSFEDLRKSGDIAESSYRGVNADSRKPENYEGRITSPVYSFADTGTSVTDFSWGETGTEETFTWFEFRISDSLFQRDSTRPQWYRIKNSQKNIHLQKTADGEYLRGKHYQWRAHLVPSPDGRESPGVYGITLRYQADSPPSRPLFLEKVETGDGYVILKWKKNVEADIYGYRIYYGIKPGVYNGRIETINGSPVTNRMADGNYITVRINNRVIEENRILDRRGLLTYPVLENTVLYFFAVSAYDSYKPDTAYNHESELSQTVTARPYAGTEID